VELDDDDDEEEEEEEDMNFCLMGGRWRCALKSSHQCVINYQVVGEL
jgi:hypothetical protein